MKEQSSDLSISTGQWGCGAFGGDITLKFIQQVMACVLCNQYASEPDFRLEFSSFLNDRLKSELEGFKPELMKKASTQEKIVLPTAEDVKQERQHTELISGLEGFDKNQGLKHTTTEEKVVLPSAEDMQQEKTQQAVLKGVETFDPKGLKHTETQEKIILPDQEAIQTEKTQQNLIEGIESFDQKKLKHAETQEKNSLPTKEVIDQEKQV